MLSALIYQLKFQKQVKEMDYPSNGVFPMRNQNTITMHFISMGLIVKNKNGQNQKEESVCLNV